MKSIKIGFKTDEFKRMQGYQSSLVSDYENLDTISKTVLGVDKIEDPNQLISNPSEYLIEQFFKLYGKSEPSHVNREAFLMSKIKVDFVELNQLKKRIIDFIKKMGKNAPTISAKGLVLNLKESDFNIYLDPNRKDEYNALEAFLNAAEVIKEKYNGTEPIHLNRFHANIWMSGGKCYINPYNYAL